MNEKKNIYLIFLTFNNDTIVPLVVGLAVWTALLYFNKRSWDNLVPVQLLFLLASLRGDYLDQQKDDWEWAEAFDHSPLNIFFP